MLWIMLMKVFCCAVERFYADLEWSLDETAAEVCQPPVRLGRMALTAVAGTARLHTDKQV